MVEELRLRPPREQDEQVALAAHTAMLADGFTFLLGLEEGEPWVDYVRKQADRSLGINVLPGWVPSSFLFATVGSQIVGRVSIRHEFNDYLAACGGHIGYGVVPEFRGRGYATKILGQALVIARSKGIDRVLLTCDERNVASARVIEKCGGVYESSIDDPKEGVRKRRYWID